MIATTYHLAQQLSLTDEMATADAALLQLNLAAAQDHVERLLGYRIEDTFGGVDQGPVPPPLTFAVLMLAAWWYEQREAALTGGAAAEVPFGVAEIVNVYREFTF